jgi:erythromycin esterase-like protein
MEDKQTKPIINLFLLLILPVFLLIAVIYFKNNAKPTYDLKNLPLIQLNQQGLQEITDQAGDANYVLLGESSHGTAEYYDWRREISKKLIQEKGFSFIAVEGDWAALYRVNQYVKHQADTEMSAREILASFERWPTWMWANEEFLQLVEWLHEYNRALPLEQRVGIYGKDVYGVSDSISQVLVYLEQVNQELANSVQQAYQCLLVYDDDFSAYINDYLNQNYSCEAEVSSVVTLLRENSELLQSTENNGAAFFNAKQNALAAKHGELYYRNSAFQGPQGWNSRVEYMKETVNRLTEYYSDGAKGIIWAHNTHVGDARATDMVGAGMINIGQLLRERYGEDRIFIIGFGTNQGNVAAGREWGDQLQVMTVPEARIGSIEHFLSGLGHDSFILFLTDQELPPELTELRGHRAKGVVYNPEREAGNYVTTLISQRYDAFIFIKETQALTAI